MADTGIMRALDGRYGVQIVLLEEVAQMALIQHKESVLPVLGLAFGLLVRL